MDMSECRGHRTFFTGRIVSKRTGEILPDAPVDAIVRNTIAVLDGLQQQWVAEPHTMSMVTELRVYLDQLRAAWGTPQK
ncbi:hypothetical protein SRABI83_02288 [Arthrobacter sp. Bi83]|uniref:hypothetical protein n=1 Tax=Arthrobacter sp. Bi83 TaxID=2822353 RepID=UPI001D443F2A|nr:hypothetical protein [Arthrobacter sp. Bi83]CAH0217154.1 hypothetical protein SRABI83_02288 [Arthrobacter sp. Bi83]